LVVERNIPLPETFSFLLFIFCLFPKYPAPLIAFGIPGGANYSQQSKGRSMNKKLYESTFIVNAALDDAQIDGVIEKVKDTIAKNGGAVRDLAKWGRKRFAYAIRKKNNGFYVVCEFDAAGDLIPKLERHYQLDENIIRYLTIALDKKALQSRIKPSDLLKQATPETPTPVPAAAAIPAPAVAVPAPVAEKPAAPAAAEPSPKA